MPSCFAGRLAGKGKLRVLGYFCAVVISLLSASTGAAAETEVREFHITVDGSTTGRYRMSIECRDDDTVSMAGQASVVVKKFGITVYRYTYSGTEVWQGKEGRLLGMNSVSNDNGTKFEVNVVTDPAGLRVRVNGQARVIRGEVLTMTYWRLAPARFHNRGVSLLDTDTGRDYNGRLEFVGNEQVQVAGQNQNCRHFRVTGGPYPVDLWYDGQDRLVRQDFTEDGHRTVLNLASIRR